jgi:exosortase
MTSTTQSAPVESASKAPELAECWRRLPHKAVFGILLVAWIALFHWLGNSTFGYKDTSSLFGWLQYAYSMKTEEEHVFIVPFVVAILLWLQRDELLAAAKGTWWPALGLLALALALHIAGYIVQQTRISFLGFLIGLYALAGITWGAGWLRASFFPLFLLLFCMPLGSAADKITQPLRLVVAELAVSIGHYGLGIDVIRQGSQIFDSTHSIHYDVAPACSGIRSLVALGLISTSYGFVCFKRFWKRWLIVLAAIPLAVIGNTVRITTTILVGKVWGQAAGARIEQNLGFVTYVVALATLFALGYWLREDKLSKPGKKPLRPEVLQPEVMV